MGHAQSRRVIEIIRHLETAMEEYFRQACVWSSQVCLLGLASSPVQSPLFISMRRDRHPYAYKTFMLVRRVDLSHTDLVGTRVGMLVGGLCSYAVCL